MSNPPERISLKRRRSDETIEYLRFEKGKRRHTDFFFQRLQNHPLHPLSRKPSQLAPTRDASRQGAAQEDSTGIPTVRATAPGDEIQDFQRLRAAQRLRAEARTRMLAPRNQESPQPAVENNTSSAPALAASVVPQLNVRRFHLTSDLTDKSSHTKLPATSQKQPKSFKNLRPPLATFVERQPERKASTFENIAAHQHQQPPNGAQSAKPSPVDQSENVVTTKEQSPTLQKQDACANKTGQSMQDHPSTWDFDSDELADELAAFAMQLDPGTNHYPTDSCERTLRRSKQTSDVPMVLNDDYVYETYIRVSYGDPELDPMVVDSESSVGILVIDEEDEDLWQEYQKNEDDTDDDEWDDEDSNAEDNPINDYPEDEVDTDDEYGHNSYRYRNHGSDNELYDEEYDE